MKTFEQFLQKPPAIPLATTWLLTDLSEALGKQQLFTHQSPQKLKTLREHALIESAVSSNRIEGIHVEPSRIKEVVLGKKLLHDRDEEEVRGYRKALELIHSKGKNLPISVETILTLHKLTRPDVWDSGKLKDKHGDIIEKYPDGKQRVRFRTVSPKDTPVYLEKLIELWHESIRERSIPPLIALVAFNFDFLCIHPFRDGNGRVSRLLFLLQLYHLGFEVGRYISLERIIEENKERYYETLERSSQGWHEGKHDAWPVTNHLLFILKTAYREFEERVSQIKDAKGSKTAIIHTAISTIESPFSLGQLQQACPSVSRDFLKKVLQDLKKEKKLKILGLGRDAKWQKV